MKTRVLVAGVVAIAVIAGGGAFAVNMVEKKTEQAVRDALAEISASAETVTYSFWGKKLSLGNVAYDGDAMGMHTTCAVDGIVVDGFNRDCLDEKASGLPLVANSVVVSGMKVSSRTGEVVSETSTAELRVEGWYQSLGKLAALYRTAPWSEAFFAEAYRYRLDMMAYKNYEVTATSPKFPRRLTESVAMMGLLGPAGGKDGMDGRHLSLFANDIHMDMGGMTSSIARMEWRGITLPQPAFAARFMPLVKDMAQAKSPAVTRKAMDELSGLFWQAYATESPYSSLLIQNMGTFTTPKSAQTPECLVLFDEFENTLTVDTPFLFGLRFKGWRVNAKALPRDLRPDVEAFVPMFAENGLPVDGSVKFSLAPASVGASRMDYSFGVADLGEGNGSLNFTLDVAKLGELIDNPDLVTDKLRIHSADLVYTDRGLVALGVTNLSHDMDKTPLATQKVLLAGLPSVEKQFGASGPMLVKALSTMLEKPGTLTVKSTLKAPMPPEMLMMAVLMAPQSLGLTMSAEPGSKDFAEYLPASLK